MKIPVYLIEEAKQLALTRHENDATGHDRFHVQRVVSLAIKLSIPYPNVDIGLVQLIAWLHDIDDRKLSVEEGHVTVSEFLDRTSLDIETKLRIIEEIKNLPYTASIKGLRMSTLEGKIVQDADRLDAIGAIGIARVFAYGGSKGRPIDDFGASGESSIDHFYDKLLKLEGLMNTEQGRELARDRTQYLLDFLHRFKLEQGFYS